MKGLSVRNHAMLDSCFFKILGDNPKMDPKVELAWVVTAKNSYPAHGGFSSSGWCLGSSLSSPMSWKTSCQP